MPRISSCLATWSFACAISTSALAVAQTAPPAPPSTTPSPWVSAMPPAAPVAAGGAAPAPAWNPYQHYVYPYYVYPYGYPPPYAAMGSRARLWVPPARAEKPPMSGAKIAMIVGGAELGAGWLASVFMGIGEEIGGVRCSGGYWGIPTCSGDDIDWGALFIPVAGPFLLLQESRIGDGEKAVAAALGGLQLVGIASFALGLGLTLSGRGTSSPGARSALTWRLSPAVGPSGGTLGVAGTF